MTKPTNNVPGRVAPLTNERLAGLDIQAAQDMAKNYADTRLLVSDYLALRELVRVQQERLALAEAVIDEVWTLLGASGIKAQLGILLREYAKARGET